MWNRIRSLAYRELARLWRHPDRLGAAWRPHRRGRLLRLLERAGYEDLARVERRRLAALPAGPSSAGSTRGWEPVESLYFPWTSDSTATLPFARDPGYLMGDSAAHMVALMNSLHLEAPADMIGRPDHLSLELELMALLVLHAPPATQRQYMTDRLTWVPRLHRAMTEAGAGSYPLALGELTQGFLAVERAALEQNMQVR